MKIIWDGFEGNLVLSDKEMSDIAKEEAVKIDKEVRRGHPQIDADDQVDWSFRRTWRRQQIKANVFGTDYDYWNEVVDDAVSLLGQMMNLADRDPIADKKAQDVGFSKSVYTGSNIGIWENAKRVPQGKQLEGPRVDVGPFADFSVFLEAWDRGNMPGLLDIYRKIGVVHAAARELAAAWRGIHVLYPMTVAGEFDRSSVITTPGRAKPVNIFPIIRIRPRHYKGPY